jgi:cell division septation protein DedD
MRTKRVVLMAIGVCLTLAIAACSRVSDDWRSAQAADTTEAYQHFLQQHADSEFGAQAQERIKQLAEDRDWQQASTLDTRDAYEQFVGQHADGKWAQEARVRIENFQLAAGAPAAAGAVTAPAVDAAMPSAAPAASAPAPAAKPAPAKPAASKPAKPAAKEAAKEASKASSSHYAQLGAFSSEANAESEWHKVSTRWPKLLGALKPHYAAGKSSGKTVYRLQVALPSRDKALALCAALKKQSQPCVASAE